MLTKPRVIVASDITSTRAGYKEPDDCQSLVRLLSMSDQYDIEGLIASSRLRHGQDVCPEHLREVVRAYGDVRGNLLRHNDGFVPAEQLLECVRGGQPIAEQDLPVEQSVGEGKDTEASNLIIQRLQHDDARPLWMLFWGGTADLAQALWQIRESLPADEQRRLLQKLRVFAISDQDTTGAWIRKEFPQVWYLLSMRVHRGMYRWGDTSLCTPQWLKANVIEGHGTLGGIYPDYDGGDIFGATLGKVRGIKEGDTPSFLYLFNNGLSVPERPELGSWGGRFVVSTENPRQFVDAEEDHEQATDEITRKAAGVFRWRAAYQNEFAARMDWCVRGPGEVSRPPVASVAGDRVRRVRVGEAITLDASASRSADGGPAQVRWYCYPEVAGAQVEFADPASVRTQVVLRSGGRAHVVAEVTGAGDPPMTRYARVELIV